MSEQAEPYPQPESARRRRVPVALIVTAVVVVLAAVAGVLVAVLGGDDGRKTTTEFALDDTDRHLALPAHLDGFTAQPTPAPEKFEQALRRYLAPIIGSDDDILRHGLSSQFHTASGQPIVFTGVALRDVPTFADRVRRDGVDRSLQTFMRNAAGTFTIAGPSTRFSAGPLGGSLRCVLLKVRTSAEFRANACEWSDGSVFTYAVYAADFRPLAQTADDTLALRGQVERTTN